MKTMTTVTNTRQQKLAALESELAQTYDSLGSGRRPVLLNRQKSLDVVDYNTATIDHKAATIFDR
jgi:hypothetical protein